MSHQQKKSLWIVVPAYNEEKLLPSCLDALINQIDSNFTLLIVNNNSTDNTLKIIKKYQKIHSGFDLQYINEEQKGTGAACDSGFRYAICHGARYVARTDSDAMARPDWAQRIRIHFKSGKLFIAGRLRCRTDEPGFTKWDLYKATIGIYFAELIAKTWHRGPQYRYPMFMAAGLNMAISAEAYLQSGGFPRTSIDVADEDLVLHLKVRGILDQEFVVFDPKLIVYGSPRRVKSYGYINILLWYWNKKYKREVVDIR